MTYKRCGCGEYHYSEATTGKQIRRGEEPWPTLPRVRTGEILRMSPRDVEWLYLSVGSLADLDRSSSGEQPPPLHRPSSDGWGGGT